MISKAKTVAEYIAALPPDRRKAIEAVRKVIKKNLGKGYAEGMTYGMIGYYVPHSVYPPGYHCDPKMPLPFAGLASQKQYMSVYLCTYMNQELETWFKKEWAKTGKKLDMGKCCIRFKTLEDLPVELIGKTIKRVPVGEFIAFYESAMKQNEARKKKAKRRKVAAAR